MAISALISYQSQGFDGPIDLSCRETPENKTIYLFYRIALDVWMNSGTNHLGPEGKRSRVVTRWALPHALLFFLLDDMLYYYH